MSMEIGTAIFLIFCTPLGWIGLFLLLLLILAIRG
jgi:hypothetical protein